MAVTRLHMHQHRTKLPAAGHGVPVCTEARGASNSRRDRAAYTGSERELLIHIKRVTDHSLSNDLPKGRGAFMEDLVRHIGSPSRGRLSARPDLTTLDDHPAQRNRGPVGDHSGALDGAHCRSLGARVICRLARAFCLKPREAIGFGKLSLHSAVAAGVLAATVGSMAPASGDTGMNPRA